MEEKESLERELYSRFVLVLNEKKAKIRDLQTRVNELQQSVDEDEPRCTVSLYDSVSHEGYSDAHIQSSSVKKLFY